MENRMLVINALCKSRALIYWNISKHNVRISNEGHKVLKETCGKLSNIINKR